MRALATTPDRDPLHVATLIITFLTTLSVVLAIFLPLSFSVHNRTTGETRYYSLLSSLSCEDANGLEDYVCHGASLRGPRLDKWVQVAQIVAVAGLILCFFSLLLQLLLLCRRPRILLLHHTATHIMALAGALLGIVGHLAHHHAVWRDPLQVQNQVFLRVDPLSSGLLLLAVLGAAICCVLLHVSSHGPGPLSTHTCFLQTYATADSRRQMSHCTSLQSLAISFASKSAFDEEEFLQTSTPV